MSFSTLCFLGISFSNDYDNDTDNDNDNVDKNDDNDNKQNKSKIDAPKNIKLPPSFRATR